MLNSYIFFAYISIRYSQRRYNMYKTKSNVEIGTHLDVLIKQSPYKNARQFGIAYIKTRFDIDDPSSDEIQKMQNRICQIEKGKKGIQITDLPIFASLLGVTVDDLLSAGTYLAPTTTMRRSNYSIAHSTDPAEWMTYIKSNDKAFLNPDEFNKTVIDYALEADNYALLKDLLDNGIIYLVGEDKDPCYLGGFGAGTTIQRRDISHMDMLDHDLKYKDEVRLKMICLAIKKKDFDTLNTLLAKQMPVLYTLNHQLNYNLPQTTLPYTDSIKELINNVASSSNAALSYFFEPFDVKPVIGESTNTYIFPYAGHVLDLMIRNHKQNTELFLDRALKYNQSVLKKINQSIDDGTKALNECSDLYISANPRKEALRDYYICKDACLISYRAPHLVRKEPLKGFVTNYIQISATSKDAEIQFLIDEINKVASSFTELLIEKEANDVRSNL